MPGCVNCLLGGGEEGRGYHLAFDQKGEVMVLLTSCFVSAQAESPRIHFSLSLSSQYSVTAYILQPRAWGWRRGGKRSLWYTHMTGFKMETIFKLNLEDQVCSDLATQGAFENFSSRSVFDGEKQAGMEKQVPVTRHQIPT